MATVIEELVEYCYKARYSDFPAETVERTKDLLLKLITDIVVGSREPIGKMMTKYVRDLRCPEEAGVICGGYRSSVPMAAFVHGICAHAGELEDDQFPANSSTVYVWPPILSVAERFQLSGSDVIWATIVSWEVSTALCSGHDATNLAGFSQGFAPMTIATALGKPLNLTKEETTNAASIAASKYCGMLKQAGSDDHFIDTGFACRTGVESVMLAKAGATAKPDILEGPRGLFGLLPSYDGSRVNEHLGKPPYDIHKIWVKKYPNCFIIHPKIDALLMLIKEHDIKYDEVKKVDVEVNKIDALVCDREIKTIGDSRFSMHHSLASVLLEGKVDLDTFTEEKIADPRLQEARAKVNIIVHPEWPDGYFLGTSIVTVEMKNGKRFSKTLAQPIGAPEHPLNRGQMVELCRRYISRFLPKSHCDRIEEIVLNLEQHADITELMDLLTFRHMMRSM